MPNNNQSLEDIIKRYHDRGMEWIAKLAIANQLDEGRKAFLASLINDLDKGDSSEAKLLRLAEGSDEYKKYIAGMVEAKKQAMELKVKFDALDKLYEARRSEFAMDRAKIEKGIYYEGR